MSDRWIVVVPADPEVVPTEQARERAHRLFHDFVGDAADLRVVLTDRPQFVDCGELLERVVCPACGDDPGTLWLDDLWDEAAGGFNLTPVAMPCCRASVDPRDVLFREHCRFARFRLEARDPWSISELSEEQVEAIGRALDLPVRQVIAQY